MITADVLKKASDHLQSMAGHVFDLLTVSKPISPNAAVNLAKVVSKLSPLLGNLIEFNTCRIFERSAGIHGFRRLETSGPGVSRHNL